MTLVQKIVGKAGIVRVYWDKDWEEYVVKSTPDLLYWHHTTDCEEALERARYMSNNACCFF